MIVELCRQEGIKLLTQKYPYLLIGIVLAVEAAYMAATGFAPAETSLHVVTAPQLFAEGVGWGLRFGVYMLLVLGAMGFSQEFALGTVKTVLILPIRRHQWVAAKLVALIVLAWGMLLASVVLGIALAAVIVGWGDVVRSGVLLYSLGQVWSHLLTATGLTALFLLPVCAFALLASVYFNSSGAAVGVTLVLGIVVESAAEMLDQGRWVFFHHLHVPFGQIVKLGKGLPFRWEDSLTWGLAVGAVTFAVFAGWLTVRLQRMDITE